MAKNAARWRFDFCFIGASPVSLCRAISPALPFKGNVRPKYGLLASRRFHPIQTKKKSAAGVLGRSSEKGKG
jgi:hypothetical protein